MGQGRTQWNTTVLLNLTTDWTKNVIQWSLFLRSWAHSRGYLSLDQGAGKPLPSWLPNVTWKQAGFEMENFMKLNISTPPRVIFLSSSEKKKLYREVSTL